MTETASVPSKSIISIKKYEKLKLKPSKPLVGTRNYRCLPSKPMPPFSAINSLLSCHCVSKTRIRGPSCTPDLGRSFGRSLDFGSLNSLGFVSFMEYLTIDMGIQ